MISISDGMQKLFLPLLRLTTLLISQSVRNKQQQLINQTVLCAIGTHGDTGFNTIENDLLSDLVL